MNRNNQTTKKLKDVRAGDVLYMLDKDKITDEIRELTVNGVTTSLTGYLVFDTTDGNYSPSKSSVSKSSFTVRNDSVVATSREALLKSSEKLIKKLLDRTDVNIAETKSRLNRLIEDRQKIYRLYLDIFTA